MNNDINYLIKQKVSGRTLIFDLDNTLYLELDFLKQQYLQISRKFFPCNSDLAYNYLISTFLFEGRKNLFDKFKVKLGLMNEVSEILDCFRSYPVELTERLDVYQWIYHLLEFFDGDEPFIIITNGNVLQQKEKVNRLGLNKLYNNVMVIYANEYLPKPDSSSLTSLSSIIALKDPIYIGDSFIDKEFAENCAVEFFDVKRIIVD